MECDECDHLLQHGSMELVNHMTKRKAVLNFHPCGWFGRDLHKVDGFLQDQQYVVDSLR